LEIGFQGELIFESVGLVGIGPDLSGLVIENKEEAGVNIIFIEVNAFEFVPEISLVTHQIPAEFLLVKIEVE